MILIEDLLRQDSELRGFAALPEMDPLTEADALQEAQLLDVRFDATRCTVGLLFELRLALQLREANTGVLVAHGVRDISWSAAQRTTLRTAWTVGSSAPSNADRLFGLRLGLWPTPGAQFSLLAESAAFFSGDVPGLERVPNYLDDDETTVQARIAGWHSSFTPAHAVFLDPAPR